MTEARQDQHLQEPATCADAGSSKPVPEKAFAWASDSALRAIVSASPAAIITFDFGRIIKTWNPAAERIFGWRAEEVIGRPIPYVPGEHLAESLAFAERIKRGETFEGIEAHRVRKDGTPIQILISSAPLRDASGRIQGVLAVTTDITERKRAEEALQQSEARNFALAQLLERVSQPFAIGYPDGRMGFCNDALCALLGFSPEELSAKSWSAELTPPEWRAPEQSTLAELHRTGKPQRYQKELLRKDGSSVMVELLVDLIYDSAHQVHHYCVFLTDIAERRRIEEALTLQARILETMVESVCVTNRVGRIHWTNPRFDELFGYDHGELLGQLADVLNDYSPEENRRFGENLIHELNSKGTWFGEIRNRRKDGTAFTTFARMHRVECAGAYFFVSVQEDITDRKRAEQMLREYTEKLQILSGQLVQAQEKERREIARELHDQVGQALTVVQMGLQSLLSLPEAAPIAARLSEHLDGLDHVLQQVHELSLDLRPSILDDVGLAAALRWYAQKQARHGQLHCHFRADKFARRLDVLIETACFRIAQEAVTNTLRHAKAQNLSVELSARNNRLDLYVRDDGIGFHVSTAREKASLGASLGLLSMEERASLVGGRMEINSLPGKTEMHASFPLKWRETPEAEKEKKS